MKFLHKLYLILAFSFTINNTVVAQYSNSWITHNQPYLKIGVKEKGLYKLTLNQLHNAGFPVSINEIVNLQLFHRGNEVSIIVSQVNDLFFYGEPNDGALDSLLFRPTSDRLNPYYSLYSDEGFYFLTVGKVKGKRAEIINKPIDTSSQSEKWHWASSLITFPEEYSNYTGAAEVPSLMQSYFSNQETFTSKGKSGLSSYTHQFKLLNQYTESFIAPKFRVMINGRKNGVNNIDINLGKRKIYNFTFSGFIGKTFETSDINKEDFIDLNTLDITLISNQSDGRYSLTYLLLDYPQSIFLGKEKQQFLQFSKSSDSWCRLEVEEPETKGYMLLDITKPDELSQISTTVVEDKLNAMFSPTPRKNTKLLLSIEPLMVNSLQPIQMQSIDPASYNFLFITNSTLKSAVNEYAQYRESPMGGNFKTIVTDIADIYNQFNYGEPSPIAIKNFVKYMVSDKNWEKHLFLIGHSTSYPSRINKGLTGVVNNDPSFSDYWQIPSIGYPGSDLLLVDGLDEGNTENVPGIAIGRLSATIPSHVTDYLSKVKAYENPDNSFAWKKEILHLNGGKTISELNSLKSALKSLEPIVKQSLIGGNVEALSKSTLNPVDKVDISHQVNRGIGMITYFGHGSASTTDFDMGYASLPENNYDNSDKYPFMYFNGCGVGNIYSGRYNGDRSSIWHIALSTDWVLTPKKGAIAVLANSYDSYLSTSNRYLNSLYHFLFNNEKGLSIGMIQKEVAKDIISTSYNLADVANMHQSVLQGDPALRVVHVNRPDFSINNTEGLFITSADPGATIGNSSELKIGMAINNNGLNLKNIPISVAINITYLNGAHKNITGQINNIPYLDTLYVSISNTSPISAIKIEIDPENNIVELNESNNTRSLVIDWTTAKELNFYSSEDSKDVVSPILEVTIDDRLIEDEELVSKEPTILVTLEDNFPLESDPSLFNIFLRSCDTCNFQPIEITSSNASTKLINNEKLQLTLKIGQLIVGKYELMVTGNDLAGNQSQAYRINFSITESPQNISVIVSPNPASTYIKFRINNTSHTSQYFPTIIQYTLYDVNGNSIVEYTDNKPNQYINEWFWKPVKPGIYFYRVTIFEKNNSTNSVHSGKLIVQM